MCAALWSGLAVFKGALYVNIELTKFPSYCFIIGYMACFSM